MPASLPGSTSEESAVGNPSTGAWVIFDPLSGPRGTPLDTDSSDNASTGAMCTGIGIGANTVINVLAGEAGAPAAIRRAGYDDNQIPGEETVNQGGTQNTVDSNYMYIGGGRCDATVDGIAAPDPYTAGIAICGAGNGGSRDGTVSGFAMKMVTAAGDVANGAAVETGWINRSGVEIHATESVFGSATAELGAAS